MTNAENVRQRARDEAAGEAVGDHASEQDRPTKSGRLKIADVLRGDTNRR